MIIHICSSEILKTRVKTGFLVHNIHLYLSGQVENTKWILCSRKIGGVKCAYLRFLMFKYYDLKITYFLRPIKCYLFRDLS